MTLREKIQCMEAFERGEEVEVDKGCCGYWSLDKPPSWNWAGNNYRIKPKPKQEEHKMKTQWIFFGLEGGGYGNKYHITQAMTEEEFLKQYGICVSIVSYFPVSNISMSNVKHKVQFFKNECKEPKPKKVVVIEKWLCEYCGGYVVVEGNDLNFMRNEMFKQVKLLDTYEVEI